MGSFEVLCTEKNSSCMIGVRIDQGWESRKLHSFKIVPKLSFVTDLFPSGVDQDVHNTGMKECSKTERWKEVVKEVLMLFKSASNCSADFRRSELAFQGEKYWRPLLPMTPKSWNILQKDEDFWKVRKLNCHPLLSCFSFATLTYQGYLMKGWVSKTPYHLWPCIF